MKALAILVTLALMCGCAPERAINHADLPQKDEIHYGATIESLAVERDEHSSRLEFTAVRGDVRYKVTISERDFIEAEHKVEVREGITYVDGAYAIGTGSDGLNPHSELTQLSVSENGKAVYVPENLYRDCYDLFVGQGEGSGFGTVFGLVIRILDDGALLITAPGSDGTASYLVHWWISGVQTPDRLVVKSEKERIDFFDNWRTTVPERPRTLVAPEDKQPLP